MTWDDRGRRDRHYVSNLLLVSRQLLRRSALQLGGDADLQEWQNQLAIYRFTFDKSDGKPAATGGKSKAVATPGCACKGTGDSSDAMVCALDLCDPTTVLDYDLSSPTNSLNPSMFAAVRMFTLWSW